MPGNEKWVLHGNELQLTSDQIPQVPDSGYLVKVRYAGVCGNDAKTVKEGIEGSIVLGHEICGEVVEIGEKCRPDDDVRVGTTVVVYAIHYLDGCPSCQADDTAFCVWGSPHPGFGFTTDGGFQQYLAVPHKKNLVPVPPGIPAEVAATLGCSALTGFGVATKLTDIIERLLKLGGRKPKILIISGGAVALMTVQCIRYFWGENVEICSISSKGSKTEVEKKALAEKFGFDKCITWEREGSNAEAVAMVKEEFGTFDAVCDFINSKHTAPRILPLLNKGATWMMLGTEMTLPLLDVLWKEITIQGNLMANRQSLREVLSLVADNKIRTVPVSVFPFEDLKKACEVVSNSEVTGRVVIKCDHV